MFTCNLEVCWICKLFYGEWFGWRLDNDLKIFANPLLVQTCSVDSYKCTPR